MRIFGILIAIAVIGCGGSNVGDPCTMAGEAAECGGDVCTALRGGGAACEEICDADSDCGADATCDQSGPDSDIKACRPKSDDGNGHGGH